MERTNRAVRLRLARAAAVCGALLLPAPIFAAEPITTRNRNPVLTGFGLPLPFPGRLDDRNASALAVQLDWSSSATIQLVDGEELIADAETRTVDLVARHRLANGLALRLTIPWIYYGGGVLDPFIESWHKAFGLPRGARRRLPQDQVLIGYARDEEILFLRRDGASGLGDISIDAGLSLYESPRAAFAAWLTLKLPTGDESALLGSGAVDAGFTLAADLELSDAWSLYGQLSYAYLGEGEFLAELQRDHVWRGLAGIAWQIAQPVTLKAQIEAHTAPYERTGIEFLGEAAIVTVGLDWQPSAGWRVAFAVGEDLDVRTSPDVVFHLALQRGF